ncbi:hypothetical protein ANN_06168 [Periplaneta americana]|uniref:Uncharacterized protein n=1 Tax=Periplaneta americana TaxID=6978 RepID=A0ABQ8TEE6_PERAM|nr:hypothetical protein ANN_06168 [Periplaneta americana]
MTSKIKYWTITSSLSDEEASSLTQPITSEEILLALKTASSKSAPGPDVAHKSGLMGDQEETIQSERNGMILVHRGYEEEEEEEALWRCMRLKRTAENESVADLT